uniref:Phospholipid scramblase n=1 Tax=Rhodnius prolixus TaxID=13249 RepID=T1HQH4_RHOPR
MSSHNILHAANSEGGSCLTTRTNVTSINESENRFVIKGDHGQILYSGLESSNPFQRIFCGSRRKFHFRLFDRSKQEAMFFTRRLACSTPPFGCYLQKVQVFVPPCEYIGCIQQLWTPMVTTFSIRNCNNSEIYRLEGPVHCCYNRFDEAEFYIFKDKSLRPLTTISHQWDERVMTHKLSLDFPPRLNCNYKALFTACGVLLEYMFIEIYKSGSCVSCCK